MDSVKNHQMEGRVIQFALTKRKGWYNSNSKLGEPVLPFIKEFIDSKRIFLFEADFSVLKEAKLAKDIDSVLSYWKKEPGIISSSFMMGLMPK